MQLVSEIGKISSRPPSTIFQRIIGALKAKESPLCLPPQLEASRSVSHGSKGNELGIHIGTNGIHPFVEAGTRVYRSVLKRKARNRRVTGIEWPCPCR
jgi:hypothetical protein